VAIYYVYSGAGGSNNGSSWANAFTNLTAAFAVEAAGDTLYVAHDHAESTAAAVTLTSSGTIGVPTKVICVDRAGSVPPVSADRRATAQVTVTGVNNLSITGGHTHYDGIIFSTGTGTTSSTVLIIGTAANTWFRFDNCSLRLGVNSATASNILIAGASGNIGGILVELNNTTMQFANASHQVNIAGMVKWRNTPSALLGTIPTLLLGSTSSRGGSIECIGVDFSAAGSGKTLVNIGSSQAFTYKFVDCKLDASVTKSVVPTAHGGGDIDFVRCGASGINYATYRTRVPGVLNEEITIVRTGGASDNTTPIAWKVDTTANSLYSMPFECPPIAIWNDVISPTAVTATVEGIWGGGAVPNDDDIWLEVEYLGSSSTPQGSFVNDGKADLLASAAGQTSSSATWGGSTTKFKLGVSFTAQQKGWIYARVKCAKASSTFYIDPLVTLT
jgi:hypothetical protein